MIYVYTISKLHFIVMPHSKETCSITIKEGYVNLLMENIRFLRQNLETKNKLLENC